MVVKENPDGKKIVDLIKGLVKAVTLFMADLYVFPHEEHTLFVAFFCYTVAPLH